MVLDQFIQALDQRVGRVWWGEPDAEAVAETAAELERRGHVLPEQLVALWARRNGFVIGNPHPSLPRDPRVAPGELPGVFDAAGGVMVIGAGDEALLSYFDDEQLLHHLVLGAISDIELLTLCVTDGAIYLADLDRLDDGLVRLAGSLDELLASWCDADLQIGAIVDRASSANPHPPRIKVYRGTASYVMARERDLEVRYRVALTTGTPLELAIVDATRSIAITVEIDGSSTLAVSDRQSATFTPTMTGDHVLCVRGSAPFTLALRLPR